MITSPSNAFLSIKNKIRSHFARPSEDVIRQYKLNGISLKLTDFAGSLATDCIISELREDHYGINQISFKEDDVVVNIGSHVGGFPIYLAKRFPLLKIFAFEPMPENARHFRKNIELNKIKNIVLTESAVTKDSRDLDIIVHISNTGGATAQLDNMQISNHLKFTVKSTTLDQIFKKYAINKCKLLTIDCEGSEYEILFSTNCLNKIDYLSGEFHINKHLEKQGYSQDKLINHIQRFISGDHINLVRSPMAE